jgi:hypothetical protein
MARWLLAGQAALLLLLAGMLFVREPPAPAPTFRTLATTALRPPAHAAARLRIVFAEETTERELRALLLPLGGTIVGGPSPLGVYTLELPVETFDDARVALSLRPEVRFAEPLRDEAPR